MSTIHHLCTACFFEEKRGFTFTGTIPLAEDGRCRCGGLTHRVVRLDGAELSDEVEIAYDGSAVVVRERRWEALRRHIREVLTSAELGALARRRDGLLEVVVREGVSLILQPVVDNISHQEGCLIASCIFPALGEDKHAIRQILSQMNSALSERGLLLGTLRDLFPLEEPSPVVIYRRFVKAQELDADSLEAVIKWAKRVVVFVHEALATFGYSPASVRFIQNLEMKEPIALTNDGGWCYDPQDSVALETLLAQTDEARTGRIQREVLRQHILEFLRALDIDASMAESEGTDALSFHYLGVQLQLSFKEDDRDSFLQVVAEVATGVALDVHLEQTLTSLTHSLTMGHVVLSEDEEGYRISLEDTILGDDLNADELAKVLANVAQQARTYRDSISPGYRVSEAPEGAPLDGLISFIRMRAMQQSRSPDLPRLTQRVCEYLGQLDLYPRLTGEGDFFLQHGEIPVRLILGEMVPDSYLTIRATIVDALGSDRIIARRELARLPVEVELGGYCLQADGSLTFEDTILGNSLDLNELAKTLYDVLRAAHAVRPALRQMLESSVRTGQQLIPRQEAIRGLATLYRKAYVIGSRRRAIQALAMFADPVSRECLFEALRDPSPLVGNLAACGLIADVASGGEEMLTPLSERAADHRLSDSVRKRALRVLAAAKPSPSTTAAISQVARDASESICLRAFSFESLGVGGLEQEVRGLLIEGLLSRSSDICLAALRAAHRLGLSAAEGGDLSEALSHLVKRSGQRGQLLDHIARLGMQGTVIDTMGDSWGDAVERARGLVTAAATATPVQLELLREMLANPRGEIRSLAYEVLTKHKIGALAEPLASALSKEPDEALKPLIIAALSSLEVFSREVVDALQKAAQDAKIRRPAHEALDSLRHAQMKRMTRG